MQKTHRHFAVAIDGPAGAGKTTMARMLAKKFELVYVDTGAMFRAIGVAALRQNINPHNEPAVKKLLPHTRITFGYLGGVCHTFLNGEDVSEEIRTEAAGMAASAVGTLPSVRTFLLNMQRDIAKTQDVVMEGRDIGTVVLPKADLKVFLTATPEERARRRFKELTEKGKDADPVAVLNDIKSRDFQDMNRETAPLKQADTAIRVDSTNMNIQETYHVLCQLVAAEKKLCSK